MLTMYAQDYDERFMSQNNADGPNFDDNTAAQVLLQPYIKNRNIFYCPSRNNFNCVKWIDPTGRCLATHLTLGCTPTGTDWASSRCPRHNPVSLARYG
ncbi:MAG: hypothetical protein KatS3mg023_2971 [Armatimonadota bacterium]|nr:MAG: hypothetical protein KatS3mg023_2971 [Armatimonadota bacterium]